MIVRRTRSSSWPEATASSVSHGSQSVTAQACTTPMEQTHWRLLMDDFTADRSNKMNAEGYRSMICDPIQPLASKLNGPHFITQQDKDKDLQRTAEAAKQLFKVRMWDILDWSSQWPDLSLTE